MSLRIPPGISVTAVYLLACRIMLAPICNFARLATANFAGDTRLIIWTLAWDNHALLDHVRPFFDANIFFPASDALAYSEHLFGISLFSLPVYALTRNPVLAYNVVWILSFLLAAAAAHLLSWRYTHDHLAATVGGLAFGFCFYRMHQGHGHLHMIWNFGIPLTLIAMERYVAMPSWRRLSALGALAVLQVLASWYQAVMLAVAGLLFVMWLVFVEQVGAGPSLHGRLGWWKDDRARRWLARFVLQSAAGAAVALVLIWPFARHYHVLNSASPTETASGAADLAGFFIPPENTFMGQWMLAHGIRGPRWIWGELTLYLGWLTAALATLGTVVAVRSATPSGRRVRFFAVLGLVSIALAVGPSSSELATGRWGWSPYGLLMHLPGVDLFRVPARFAELLTLALAVLAAAGCAALRARFGRIGTAVTVIAIPLMLSEFYVVNFPGGAPAPFPVPPIYKVIATLPPGAVVSLPDYADTAISFEEADYQYFSTTHWHPIANGYSRAAPPGFRSLMDQLSTFPSPSSAETMRTTGVVYLVLHARQMERGAGLAARAGASRDFRLLAQYGDDYLFGVVPAATRLAR